MLSVGGSINPCTVVFRQLCAGPEGALARGGMSRGLVRCTVLRGGGRGLLSVGGSINPCTVVFRQRRSARKTMVRATTA